MQSDVRQKDLFPDVVAVALPKTPAPPPPVPKHDDVPADELEKAPGAFKTIGEAAKFLDVPQHVLRFWEARFSQIKPLKRSGGRRYYRQEDMEVLSTIKNLLYKQGYTIKGAKKLFNARAPKATAAQPAAVKPIVSEKQRSQLTTIRQELIALRDQLQPYI